MKKNQFFRINQNIEVALADEEHFFKTIIYEIEGDSLLIALPTQVNQRFMPQVGETVTGRFAEGDALFVFKTTVLERTRMDNIPLFRLKKPATLTRRQRRNFFRYNVISSMEFMPALEELSQGSKNKYKPENSLREKASTLDIGGGGIRFASKKRITEGTMLKVKLELKIKGVPDFASATGRVVRVIPPRTSGDPYTYCLMFVDIKEMQRDKIINHIFTLMRKRMT